MPIIAMAASAAINQGVSAYKFYEGNKQKKKGEKMKKDLKDPFFDIPDEIHENVDLSERLANEGIGAAERNFFEEQNSATQAGGARAFKGRKAGMMGAEVLAKQRIDSNRAFLIEDSTRKLDNQRFMMGQKDKLADYKTMQFDINEMQPFERKYNEANALIGAGQQNKMNALNDFASSTSSAANAAGAAAGAA